MKIVSIVGARPQFVKMASLNRSIKQSKKLESVIVHTGQHYDPNMSSIFFEQMEIPQPDYNLAISIPDREQSIALMTAEISAVLQKEKPSLVVVFGDTNSTLAGAQAAYNIGIPLSHIEAGLRSYNELMPEELNRVATDNFSSLLFAPTANSFDILLKENYQPSKQIFLSGDIMFDAFKYYKNKSETAKPEIDNLPDNFILCSLHRQHLMEKYEDLEKVIEALNEINEKIPVILTAHPRTFKTLQKLSRQSRFRIVPPQSYFSMLQLLTRCKMVITDSGGLQKEAYFSQKTSLIIRNETEWTELIESGASVLTGYETSGILSNFNKVYDKIFQCPLDLYGKGTSGDFIVEKIIDYLR